MNARRASTENRSEPDGSLLERGAALEAGQAALDSAADGAGALVAFTGPIGIGRSALLAEVAARAAESGAVGLQARCSEGEQGLAFGTVLHLFEQYVVDLTESELDSLFAGRAGLASPLLTGEGLRDPGALLREVPGATLALTHALYRVTANLASRQPVVLMIDDMQWADPESLQFLLYLAPRIAEISASLVVTVRDGVPTGPEGAVGDLMGAEGAHVERLAPLAKSSVRELVTRQAGACSPRCGEACHWLTGGNPMLVHELIAAAKESGLRLDGASAAEICAGAPDRIRHRVLAQIGGMQEREVAVARAAAVLGSSVDRSRVAAITGLDDEALSSAVGALESAGILDPGHPLDYVHPLLRAAVYSQIPHEERTHLHARAATVLSAGHSEPTAVAAHLMRTRPHSQPWVVEELVRAARAARSDGELDRAVLYLGRALNEPPSAGVRPGVLVELGRAEIDRGEIGPGVAALRRALDVAGEPQDTAAALQLGRALCLHGDARAAADLLDGAIGRNGGGNEAERHELEATWLAAALIEPALRPEAGRKLKRMNGVERHRNTPSLLATVASHMVLTGGSRERAVRLATAALEDGPGKLEPAAWAPALQTLCWSGELERANATAAELAGRPPVQHSRRALASLGLAHAHNSHLAGRLEDAEREARAAVSLITAGTCTDYLECPQARLASIMLDRGDLDAAEATVVGVTGAPYPEGSVIRAQVLAVRARIHAARHRHAEALADATEAGRLAVAAGVDNPAVCSWRAQAAAAAAALGDRDRARQLADDELQLARRFGAAPSIGVALTAAAAVATGKEAVDLLVEAEAVLDGSGAELEHARTLAYLGAALRHHGSQKKARTALLGALDAATSLGAEAIADLARSELRMAGSRPRSDSATGPAALTAAEQRVTELAADGLTNREIAQELFVTKKTVEWHLSNAFRKLDVSRRDELAGALALDVELVAAG